jgi:two-component flavin-dependent monooxygenase
MSHPGLTSAAESASAVAAKHAAEAAVSRRLAPEVVDAITAAGYLRHFVPAAQGGTAGSFAEFLQAVAVLGEGCASAAWVASVSAYIGRMAAHLPGSGRQEIWANGSDQLLVGALMPFGRARPEPGGWRLSGEWSYISGVDYSAWALVCGIADRAGARYFAVPRAAYSVTDTWFNSGMRGTGSNTLTLNEVFVPDERSVPREEVAAGKGASSAAACHNTPNPAINALPFAGPALGAARGMLAAWAAAARQKVKPEAQSAFDDTLARSAGEIDVATLLLNRVAATADNGGLTPLTVSRGSRDGSLSMGYLLTAANRLFGAAGTSAHADNSPIGRAWRDTHTAASHLALRFEPAAAAFSSEYLRGTEPEHG